ncbi:hypothetical protein CVT24_009664 [Panaeolus cyanescens]|uniref:AAA+ ATPase domain-containing protein n=1 Tax=Panaeolus cyanescens TaxID=181874 RepID=A0A409Y9Y3_9AGAR|nr:hypothetical protein CVT24_009664 [Panaeolus cyanescens]
MLTRSSVLGKRGQPESTSSLSITTSSKEQLATPDSTPLPKRARKSETLEDGDHNKENIPPFLLTPISGSPSARATRALRRTSTQVVITPTRPRALRRNASTPSLARSPTKEISELRIATPPPTPPTALLPLHTRVRALLRATCNNSQALISGRDAERDAILDFVTRFVDCTAMDDDTGAFSLFISGTPGTGKTALVNAILRDISTQKQKDIKIVSINCMSLKGLDGLWERMLEELNDGTKSKVTGKKLKGREAVKSLLSTMTGKCILILDELDHITANTQSLTSIFTLAESVSDTLRMIGIANTHTLTSSTTTTAFSSSQNVRTIHFAPYTPTQLQVIIETRLSSLSSQDTESDISASLKKLLPPPAVMLLTKKVAALTGDVRSLFEVLRGAIDLAVVAVKPSNDDENPLNAPVASVTPAHILAALKAYTPASGSSKGTSAAPTAAPSGGNSEILNKVRNLGLQARLVLLAILLASKRLEAGLSLSISGNATISASPRKPTASPTKRTTSMSTSAPSSATPSLETSSLHTYYTNVLSRTENGLFEPVTRSEFGDLIGVLEGAGLVSLSSSMLPTASPSKLKRTFSRTASFGAGVMGKNGAGTVGEVRLVEGVWGDEILRGLGASNATPAVDSQDAQQEEVRAIYERESTRLARDVKAVAQRLAAANRKDTFEGAFED